MVEDGVTNLAAFAVPATSGAATLVPSSAAVDGDSVLSKSAAVLVIAATAARVTLPSGREIGQFMKLEPSHFFFVVPRAMNIW